MLRDVRTWAPVVLSLGFVLATEGRALADEATPSQTALIRLAEAQLETGHVVDALGTSTRVVDEAPAKGATAADLTARERAREVQRRAREKVAHLTVAVAAAPGAKVIIEVDGAPVDASVAQNVAVDPGEHVVLARAEGFETTAATVRVPAGGSHGLTLSLEKRGAPAVTSLPSASAPSARIETRSEARRTSDATPPTRTAAYAALVVSAGALAVGAGSYFLMKDKLDDVDERCANHVCPRDAAGPIDEAKTYGTVSTIGFATAGVAATAAVILFLVSPKTASSTPAMAFVSPRGGGIGGRF